MRFLSRLLPGSGSISAGAAGMTTRCHRSGCRPGAALAFLAVALLVAACGGRTVRTTAADPTAVDLAQLWREPVDLASRDLFAGPGLGGPQPNTEQAYTFVATDTSGFSRGYDVRDASGLAWSVKLGPEAQTEVVTSRVLWAIGYHQVPTYYVTDWSMTGGPGGNPGPGRFRPELPDRKVVGEWSWYENDFVGTQPFKGLVVANLILNNWDWKTSNNKIYEVPANGGAPRRQYIVRDLGASLGKTSAPAFSRWLGTRVAQGNRNDIADFEQQGFIKSVAGDRVEFDYSGIYQPIVDTVTPADVVWTCRLLSQISDEQWNDIFRAGGYAPDIASRYIAKLKSKIAEGLALAAPAA
jgi:hypothetical protein